jgi:hypothetical protein
MTSDSVGKAKALELYGHGRDEFIRDFVRQRPALSPLSSRIYRQ